MRRVARLMLACVLAAAASLLVIAATTTPALACSKVYEVGICVESEVPATPPTAWQSSEPVAPNSHYVAPSSGVRGTLETGIDVGVGGRGSSGPGYIGYYDPSEAPCTYYCPGGTFRDFAPAEPGAPAPAPAPGGAAPLPAPPPPPVDGGAVAQQLLDRAPFEVAQLRTAPHAPDKSYVNLENWLWVPRSQWHEVTASVDAGVATVSIVAKPTRVLWEMGDGGVTSCYDAGRPWRNYYTDAAQTGCSYTYEYPSTVEEPGGAYTLEARFYYDVSWSCTGSCVSPGGALGEYPAPAATADLVVGERQSVVIRGS